MLPTPERRIAPTPAHAARETEAAGLTSAEAAERLGEIGPNSVPRVATQSVAARIRHQLLDPLVLVLLGAAGITTVTAQIAETAVILLVVLVNTGVGTAQEIRADRAVEALAAISTPVVRVRRDGTEREVSTEAIVPGDVVVLGEGDIVPADCRVLESVALRVDEASVTGESDAVDKAAGDGDQAASRLLSGTVVVHGRAVAVAEQTGAASTLGHIARLLGGPAQATPLQRRLGELGKVLAAGTVVLCAVVLVLGLMRGEPIDVMIVTAVSLAVAAVPESLPAVVTLSLAVSAKRMASRHAIVRRLAAVETLGSMTLLATDKTGTLTSGVMTAEALWTPASEEVAVNALDNEVSAGVVDLLTAAALCNDASKLPGQPGTGDPMEVALLEAASRAGLHLQTLAKQWTRVAEKPFDSVRKRMTTLSASGSGSLVACKGALDGLIRDRVLSPGPELVTAEEVAARWSESSLRVLAVASRTEPTPPGSSGAVSDFSSFDEAPLALLGLVGLRDPVRPSAASAVEMLRSAGVELFLVTGDSPATAAAVAREVGISSTGERAELAAAALVSERVPHVLARATPEDKLRLVERWQREGAVVAMTGDGVNDGPALRRADIGVAMGRRGTEVARQAADVVLADDELGSIVAGVEEGRRVYANIRRFLLYGLSGGVAELVVMVAGPFVGMTLPLLPAQILWVNLLTHGIVGVALGAEPAERHVLRAPPRPPHERVLGQGLARQVLLLAALVSAASLGVGAWLLRREDAWQTGIFLTLAAAQLGVAIGVRTAHRDRTSGTSIFPWRSGWVVAATATSALLLAAAVLVAPLRQLLSTDIPSGRAVVGAAVAAVTAWFCTRLLLRTTRR